MPEMRYFYAEVHPGLNDPNERNSREITENQARALERTGAAHVASGSTYRETSVPYVVFLPGPGNCWIETVEGSCPQCGCMAKLHTKTYRKPWPDSRSEEWSLPSSWDYGTK